MKAIISGASKGIGKAIAIQLAKQGYDLILMARDETNLKKLQTELSAHSVSIEILALDLTLAASFKLLAKQTNLSNHLNILVNNLGIFSTQQADKLSIASVQKQLETNLYSAIQLTQTVLPQLKKQTQSTIINIGSVMSLTAEAHATDYSISKHAFKAWNDGLREQLRKENIKVSAIYPGSVNTPSWDGIDVDREQMIQAKDIAKAVDFIVNTSKNALVEEIRISPKNFSF